MAAQNSHRKNLRGLELWLMRLEVRMVPIGDAAAAAAAAHNGLLLLLLLLMVRRGVRVRVKTVGHHRLRTKSPFSH